MLDVRRLHVLREVGLRGSFSAAAESLGYTQPAISRQIATLEAETGMTLVRRLPSGIQLTDAGHLLVAHTETILARLSDAETELRALSGLDAGRLRLATFASAAATVVPLAIAAFRERHPAVELEVIMADPADSLPQLRAGELDIALSHDPDYHEPGRAPQGDIEAVHLFDDPMYVALPVGHPLAERAALKLSQFADEPWMLATTQTCPDSRLFLRACHQAGFEPRIAFQNDDYNAVLGFVAVGVGVALIPDMASRGVRDDVIIRSLEPKPPARPIIAVLPAGYRSPAAVAMLEVLREVSREWVDRRSMADAA
ncbi:MAG TPA: LysR family transcriptional regulator [Solirubrobacteraceae bacterium]|jgi:DNA-binding transcriptional LysR family regulator|nr:LysR family transcriptional regulator [Solirubrobacteraceae bacterium]